jgi:hypothetical protein
MEIYLTNEKLLELTSDLAYERAVDEIKRENSNNDIDIYATMDGSDVCFIYTEEFQDVFNRWYDYFYNKITKFK